jgi:hypothetical protein
MYLPLLSLLLTSVGSQTLAPGVHDRALVLSKGSAVALNFKDSYRAPLPSKPLWRKREVVRQERTIHYTTIDAEGVQQVSSLLSLLYRSSISSWLLTKP